MKPELRFHSYISAVVIVLMYFLVKYAAPAAGKLPLPAQVITPFIGIILSLGVYRLMASVLLSFAKNWNWLKRHLLGPSYINGTWVGKYRLFDGSVARTVEHFEQNVGSLQIRGTAYLSNGAIHAQWSSVSATINETSGSIIYTYTCTTLSSNVTHQGLCDFQFQRENAESPPTVLVGYSADLTDGIRIANSEHKVSDKLIDSDQALRLQKT
jgi:hypothetical protein